MKLVFFGSSELGHQCCRMIIENRLADVVGIVTQPRSFNTSYADTKVTNVLYRNFHSLGEEFDIPVIEVIETISKHKGQLAAMNPDFLLVIGWYFLIPQSIRNLAPLGCSGIHASLLPKYRGGSPLVWAIINGEQQTGISLFYFDDGVDSGDIIAQESFAIGEQETIRDVLVKAENASINVLKQYLPEIARGKAPRIKQKHDEAIYVPQRCPEDGKIDWRWDTGQIRNFIRAQTKPYPGAFTLLDGKKVIIWDADICDIKL